MYLTLTTIGQQAIMDAQDGGYKLELGTASIFRTGTPVNLLPLELTTALLDANVQGTWATLATGIEAVDEYSAESPDVFHVVVNLPSTMGDFEFDAIALYLANGTLLGVGTYERLIPKVTLGDGKTSNALELEVFIRFASIADVIQVTRDKAYRPYSYITEVDKADLLGNVISNNQRIYRVTRPINAMGAGKNAFTSFLVHAGTAFFDSQNKDYQQQIWVPSDHLAMFGSDTMSCKLMTDNTMVIRIPKNQYPMIEHLKAEVPYLIATCPLGNIQPPTELRGLLLEATLNVVAESSTYYEAVLLLPHSTFQDLSLRGVEFGAVLYASNSDLFAQEAVRVALRKFLEMQYAIGRTYKSDAETDPNDILQPFLGYRTYWQKLNGIVEASTSSTDGRMASAGQIYDLPDYATGGETLLAPVIRATNIWLRYDPAGSGAITYDLTADRTSVNEGGSARFTLRTTGLANGSLVAYNVTGISQDDLTTGTLSGYFTINNNVGTADFTLKMDETTEGVEDMRLYIVQDPTVFKVVSVQDTSVTLNVSAFFAVDPTTSTGITQMNEGDTRYFVCIATGIADGTYLYPAILQSSIANVYDLSQAVPSSVRVTDGRATFAVTATADRQTEGNELLSIGLFRDSNHTQSLVSASVTIMDTSRASTVNAYFADAVSGGNNISNTTVNEGAYVYLVIETTGYPLNTVMALRYGNSANPSATEVSESDFASVRPSTVTLDASGRGIVAYPIANDYAKDRDNPNILETFNVELSTTDNSTILARTMISIRDTSTLDGGAFTIADITDPANISVVFNSNVDKLATIDVVESTSGIGIKDPLAILGAVTPVDLGLHVGRKYRLIWIQSETASNSVTRVALNVNTSLFRDTGVGMGTSDLSSPVGSSTAGKLLNMITDANNVVLGYGAVFEFEVYASRTLPNGPATISPINVKVYYPNGVPGATYEPGFATTNWALARSVNVPVTDSGSAPAITNLYGGSYEESPQYTFSSKMVTLPFGSVVDLLVISPSGAGGTSSLATSGAGVDGQDGRKLEVRIPKYLGNGILDSTQPLSSDGISNEKIIIEDTMLWDTLLTITGGSKGKGQNFDQALTNLGGVSSALTVAANKGTILSGLATGKLFARMINADIEYEIICEVIHTVQGKDYQKGKSTNSDQSGGLGLLPLGSINNAGNIRGAGGKGGASIGTGFGYAGGGGSGGMYVLRLGTRILTEGLSASATLGPVTFFLTDADAVVRPSTDPIALRKPFNKAMATELTGANKGDDGSDLYVAQLAYARDGHKYLDVESKIGTGSAPMFVRPTHNAASVPTLPLKTQTDWDASQFAQMAVGKYGIGRIILMPTGVEGQYNNGTDDVDGKASKPTNLLLYPTLEQGGASAETVGSTFVFVASAQANTQGSPVLTKAKLDIYQNTSVLTSKVKNGDLAVTDGDNTYSRGGYVDLFISNNSTSGKAFFAELPRVDISDDNPLKVVDPTPYDAEKTWSNDVDADGNSLSSYGYNLAQGDGVVAYQNYVLGNIVSVRPWIAMPIKPTPLTDTNAPIILKQGECVTLTVVGGGGAVSTRDPLPENTTADTAFNGQALTLSLKALGAETYTDFLSCSGGTGSIDNTTNAVPSSTVATFDSSVLASYLRVIGSPVLTDGTANPIKAVHGGDGSGAYAKVTLMNYYPSPIVIKATGGKGGSGETALQVSDGAVLITVN